MPFDYWHRKQSGGRGEYARVIGYIEPLPAHLNTTNEFQDKTTGTGIPKNFIPGIKKGFFDYCEKGQVYYICIYYKNPSHTIFHPDPPTIVPNSMS